jgi:uncharacterized protein (DUF2236 family)
MSEFVRRDSIVRRIWGDVDVIMLVFAGSAAEFGLNRAVDWLFVTGDLPRDPIGRFFSTAAYARRIAFGSTQEAERAFAAIRGAHAGVEKQRGGRIPDWAHRDVLYMLIDHSERAYQALYRPLTPAERDDLYDVFHRIGLGLGIPDLPTSYAAWLVDRERHLENDLAVSEHSRELDRSYRRAVGWWRMIIVRQLQAVLSPRRVVELADLPRHPWIRPFLPLHSVVVRLGLRGLAHRLLVPAAHIHALRALDLEHPARRGGP